MKSPQKDKMNRDEIARVAGVSAATVSRVFNHPDLVSKKRKDKVLQVAQSLNYTPDKTASRLRRGVGNILFLELATHTEHTEEDPNYYNWFYADIIKGVKDVINASIYHLDLLTVESIKRDLASIAHHYSGIICSDFLRKEDAEAIAALGVPYVAVCHSNTLAGVNRCYTDNFQGGTIIGTYLRDTGHVRPAFITTDRGIAGIHHERFLGFSEAFKGYEIVHICGDLGIKGGYDSAKRLMKEIVDKRIDCIGVINDLTAVGVYHALNEHNLHCPDDISITGYDNLPIGEVLPGGLTSIDISFRLLYHHAVSRLLESIETGEPIDFPFNPHLVVRGSVGRL